MTHDAKLHYTQLELPWWDHESEPTPDEREFVRHAWNAYDGSGYVVAASDGGGYATDRLSISHDERVLIRFAMAQMEALTPSMIIDTPSGKIDLRSEVQALAQTQPWTAHTRSLPSVNPIQQVAQRTFAFAQHENLGPAATYALLALWLAAGYKDLWDRSIREAELKIMTETLVFRKTVEPSKS